MNPVVPKIRVGDVLHGTKNLRSYLRTCSLIRYFRALDRHRSVSRPSDAKKLLYTPNKQDKFVVCVNNHDRFCVWSTNLNVMLLFTNTTRATMLGPDAQRMNGKIFAQWFVKTNGRMPDVKAWPEWAHYVWGSLHMNAWRNPEMGLQFHMPNSDGPEDVPFIGWNYLGQNFDRATIAHAVKESVTRGVFRNLPNAKKQRPSLMSGMATGPNLQELEQLRHKLTGLMRNPRLLARAKSESGVELTSVLTHVQNNVQ